MSDESLRASCFASLDVLSATHGEDIPYRGGLEFGFAFRGRRIPFLSPQKGIFRAAAQEGPAALSVNTSANSPYDDEETPDGFFYAYRAGSIDQPDNRALRAAYADAVPLVYFIATRPGFYKPLYPSYVIVDDPVAQRVLVAPGRMVGPLDERDPILVEDPLERQYAVRDTRVRLHQARFRGRILVAYSSRCTICRLKETRLLDAAHIAGDLEVHGEPMVSNGLSLCSIHHRAFDENLVGISPDYTVHVAQRLLEDEDGPMLELLKTFHSHMIDLPNRRNWQPDRERLAERFDRFRATV
ncbi:MAG TPA: HNH endonuclease [Gaiellaceae bacterium]|nr:HNH endonuclease [Gaiellaceae bacterium]